MPNRLVVAALVFSLASSVQAEKIRIAVANNFAGAMTVLVDAFEQSTGHEVIISFASTGKHYAQVTNGAPFDAFFAADVRRPKLLDEEGIALKNTRRTYAIGKLALWSLKPDFVDDQGLVLQQGTFNHLAIANPKLAPYGLAASEVLKNLGLWDDLRHRLVRGENIGQTYQFVGSGNAELGFVALSQVYIQKDKPASGSLWPVPQDLYSPIEQQAVLLKDSKAGRDFMSFLSTKKAREIIRAFGYGLPADVERS